MHRGTWSNARCSPTCPLGSAHILVCILFLKHMSTLFLALLLLLSLQPVYRLPWEPSLTPKLTLVIL